MRRAALLSLSLLLGGCQLAARALSSPAEYEAYRAARAGYTAEARLRAARVYLGAYPEGRFADEVRGRFEEEEAAFYRARSGTRWGLDWYLEVLPDGPHASEASLRRLELARRESEQQADALVARGRSMEKRLALAASSRKQVVDEAVGWLAALSSNQSWGLPTWEQPAEILRALRTEPGPGRCDDAQCVRGRTIVFQVPMAGGGLDDRAATFDLALRLARGRVSAGVLRGPALFSRLYEAAKGQPLPADPLEARAEAVGYALEVVAGAFEAVAPGAQCDRGITPPVVFRRACNGWLVIATAGDSPADDDVLEVSGPKTP